jgi:hypothetical protein
MGHRSLRVSTCGVFMNGVKMGPLETFGTLMVTGDKKR